MTETSSKKPEQQTDTGSRRSESIATHTTARLEDKIKTIEYIIGAAVLVLFVTYTATFWAMAYDNIREKDFVIQVNQILKEGAEQAQRLKEIENEYVDKLDLLNGQDDNEQKVKEEQVSENCPQQ